jgi:quercetin dioxygenase-like cupin family protein
MGKRLMWFVLAMCAVARMATAQHVAMAPSEMKWGPAPPGLPAGAQLAVLDGDPGKPGLFTIRLKLPDGYSVAPHWHPTDENLVVIQGLFRVGIGDKLNAAAAHDLPVGAFAHMPKETHHFAFAKGETIVQVYGTGPFVLNYVNPSDDPRKAPGKSPISRP